MANVYGAFERNVVQLGRGGDGRHAGGGGAYLARAVRVAGGHGGAEDPGEQIGNLFGQEKAFTTMYGGRLAMPETPLTFEQITHIFDAGWMDAAPSGSGTYAHLHGCAGDGADAAHVHGGSRQPGRIGGQSADGLRICGEWQLSAAAGAEWMMRCDVDRQAGGRNTLTAALAVPTVQVAVLPLTKLFIDATGGTVGNTQKAAC